jgi:two-component system response regulator MprA
LTLVTVRILVVDDDRAVRESLRRSLSFNGYTVDLAEDGVEALEAINNERPDALVLDVMMPRLDGLEVCRQLRSTGDDLPILVLTARDSVSERVSGLDAGMGARRTSGAEILHRCRPQGAFLRKNQSGMVAR